MLNDSEIDAVDTGVLVDICEATMAELKRDAWSTVSARVKSQNLRSYFLGVTKEGVVRFKTTSGTTPGKFWYQEVVFEDLPEIVDMMREDKSIKPRDALLLAMKGDVKVHCFPPGMFVTNCKGKVLPIEWVIPGSCVLSSDGHRHKVLKVFKSYYSGFLYKIYTNPNKVVTMSTPNHKFAIMVEEEMVWKCASQLNPGDLVFSYDSECCVVTNIERVPYEGWVYNLEVEDTHNYFVNGLLVHNCNDPSWKYWGWQYIGTKKGYSLRSERRFPKKRNPRLTGSTCFTGETLVLTSEGYKEIKDVAVGDKVFNKQGTLNTVTSVKSYRSDNVVKVKTGYSFINTTKDHLFLVYNKKNFRWSKVEDLISNDFSLTPLLNLPETEDVDPACAFIFGLFMADGSAHLRELSSDAVRMRERKYPIVNGKSFNSIRIALNDDYKEIYLDKFRSIGIEPTNYYCREGSKSATYSINRLDILEFIAKWGTVTDKEVSSKSISYGILNWSKEAKKQFLLGWFWGDGTLVCGGGSAKNRTLYATFYNTNKQMMEIVNLLLRSFTSVSWNYYDRKSFEEYGHIVYPSKMYYCRLTSNSVSWLLEQDPTISDIKGCLNKKRRFSSFTKSLVAGRYYKKGIKIVSEPFSEEVYSLEVDGDHTYLVGRDCVVVHNCKHLLSVFRVLPFNWNKILQAFQKRNIIPKVTRKKRRKLTT